MYYIYKQIDFLIIYNKVRFKNDPAIHCSICNVKLKQIWVIYNHFCKSSLLLSNNVINLTRTNKVNYLTQAMY